MKLALKPVLVAFCLIFALPLLAQRSGVTQDPTLNKGQGLETSREDLAKMRNNSQDKNARVADMYIFAAAYSLIDSVLYVSDIQFVRNQTVNNKWFLKYRSDYEKQFRNYVAGQLEESFIPVIYFSEKEKKVIKQRESLIKRNKRKNGFDFFEVKDFQFSTLAADESNLN